MLDHNISLWVMAGIENYRSTIVEILPSVCTATFITSFIIPNEINNSLINSIEVAMGLEPTTLGLGNRCSIH